jgi:hypothetical protein
VGRLAVAAAAHRRPPPRSPSPTVSSQPGRRRRRVCRLAVFVRRSRASGWADGGALPGETRGLAAAVPVPVLVLPVNDAGGCGGYRKRRSVPGGWANPTAARRRPGSDFPPLPSSPPNAASAVVFLPPALRPASRLLLSKCHLALSASPYCFSFPLLQFYLFIFQFRENGL